MMRAACAAAAILAFASAARAQGEAWDRGIQLREQGRDADALAVFEELHQQTGSARSLAQMALAEQALRRYADAAGHLDQALASPDEWVTEHRSVLEQARAEIALARERAAGSAGDSPLPIAGGVMLGFAGAAAVVMAVAWAVGTVNANRWNDDSICLRDGRTRADTCGQEHANAELGWGLAYGFGAGAAVLAAIGVALLVVGSEGGESSALLCGPGAELGVACTGRF